MWSLVFGGGTKIVVPAPDSVDKTPQKELSPKADRKHDTARMKWNYKLLGKKASSVQHAEESRKLMRHEVFIQPRMSLSDYFLRKVRLILSVPVHAFHCLCLHKIIF